MLASFVLVAVVVGLTTTAGLVRSNLAVGLICAFLAVSMIAIAVENRGIYLGQPHRTFRPPALIVVLLLPILWMLLQIAPVPHDFLANAAWSSTSSALGFPIAGSITIDTGATLLALAQYCAMLSTAVVVGLLALDRRVAEFTLYFLTVVAVFAAALGTFGYGQHVPGFTIVVAVGITLTCATEIRLRQRLRRRRSKQEYLRTIAGLAAGALGLAICISALLIEADAMLLFAGFSGAVVLIGLFVTRQWSLSAWGRSGVVAVGAIVLFAFFATIQSRSGAIASSPPDQAIIDRMLSDTPIFGAGAGTFDSLLPTYREIDHPQLRKANVTAVALTIEMGRAFLWISILVLSCAAMLFARAGVSRGRDYVYASAGAGVVVTVLILIFLNADVLSVPASVFLAAVAGLAWVQRRGTAEDAAFPARPHVGTAGASAENLYEVRFAFALAGLILLTEAAWVLLSERNASDIVASPFVDIHSAVSIGQRDRLEAVAETASWRGDLWANSAFAGAALLLKNSADPRTEGQTRDDLIRALQYAPYQSDVWLTFAMLAEKYKWRGADPKTLLKMAYYTGPNEADLIEARLKLAFRLMGGTTDSELQGMIRQDVSLVFLRLPALKPILVDIYKSGSPESRAFEEQLITEFDPNYLKAVRNR